MRVAPNDEITSARMAVQYAMSKSKVNQQICPLHVTCAPRTYDMDIKLQPRTSDTIGSM
jgi:hypothetical protein